MDERFSLGLRLISERIAEAHERTGLRAALRLTPNDTREFDRPPLLRNGLYWEKMLELFSEAGNAGANLLAIESTGGKEVCDEALMNADLKGVVFALGILGARDMEHLWSHITEICHSTGVVPSGDTACGFANTAMVMADKRSMSLRVNILDESDL